MYNYTYINHDFLIESKHVGTVCQHFIQADIIFHLKNNNHVSDGKTICIFYGKSWPAIERLQVHAPLVASP